METKTPSADLCRTGQHDIDLYATNREYHTYMCMLCGLRIDYPRSYETVQDALGESNQEKEASNV